MTRLNKKKQYSERIKAWKAKHPKIYRGKRINAIDKAEAVAILELGKELGSTYGVTEKRLGASKGTVWRWRKEAGWAKPKPEPKPKPASKAGWKTLPVSVRLDPPTPAQDTITVELPSGAKVTGLTPEQAGVMLKAMA